MSLRLHNILHFLRFIRSTLSFHYYLLGCARRDVVYGWWRAKAYANDIRLSDQLTALEEEDILLDKKDARHVRYLSSGTAECGVRAVEANLGQSLETQQTEKELQWICQTLLSTSYSWFHPISSCACYQAVMSVYNIITHIKQQRFLELQAAFSLF